MDKKLDARRLARLAEVLVAAVLALSLSMAQAAFAESGYVAADATEATDAAGSVDATDAADAADAADATGTTDTTAGTTDTTTDATDASGTGEAAIPPADAGQPQEGASQPAGSEQAESKYTTVAKVKLNKKRATIKNNATLKLTAELVLADETKQLRKKDQQVKWRVSDSRIAGISQDGVVQGRKSGTVTVTAKSRNGKKAKAKVKVVVNWSQMATAIPVLTYHRITDDATARALYSEDNLAISATNFKRQLKWLNDNGYHTVTASEFAGWRLNGNFLPKKSVCLTIDDGLYETYHIAYPILKKYKCKATSFLIGKNIRKKTKKYKRYDTQNHYVCRDAIEKMKAEYPGLEFQSHTYNMHWRTSDRNGIVRSWSREKIDADFAKNAKFGFTSLAYPFGHTSDTMYAALRANKATKVAFGYAMDWPATRTSPRYNIPRFKVQGTWGLGHFISQVQTAR